MNAALRETRIKHGPDLTELLASSAVLRELLARISLVAAQINLHGWAEANAGNISVNISDTVNKLLDTTGNWFLVSRTGSRYRDLARDPVPNLVLISQDQDRELILPPEAKPTSEWGCHRLLQQLLRDREDGSKVVLHAHPAEIILLGSLDIYNDETALNQALAEALPELSLYLPEGISRSPYAAPGSQDLADCSLAALGKRKVLIWQGHGIVSTGTDPDAALDLMEVATKAAGILLAKFSLTKLQD